MSKISYIQCKDVIPDTHVFVYKNEKYPFKFDYFKYASEYFSRNREEFEKATNINLLDSEEEEKTPIQKEIIESFIKSVEGQKIIVNEENVFGLKYLSEKYEVSILTEQLNEYIFSHEKELLIDILLYERERDIDTKAYELMISKHLNEYLDDDRLLKLDVATLYRIINYEEGKNRKFDEKMKKFLISSLDKYGREASVLFSHVYFGETKRFMIDLLVKKYSKIIDISYIQIPIFEVFYEIENEKKEKENLLKKYEELNKQNSEEMNKMKEKQQKLEMEISNQKNDYSCSINSLQMNIDKMKAEYEQTQSTNMKEIASLKQENEEYKQLNKVLKQQIAEKKNSTPIQRQPLNEEESKGSKIKVFSYKEGKDFNGIINYLTSKTGKNIHDSQTIEVTSNSIYSNEHHPKNLLDLNDNNDYWSKVKDQNAWICFDFKDMKIEISNYSIKSGNCKDSNNIKNWVIEISDDGNNWIQIDQHSNYTGLNGYRIIKTFSVSRKSFSRYCRFRHNGEYYGCYFSNTIIIRSIEFYGRLQEP